MEFVKLQRVYAEQVGQQLVRGAGEAKQFTASQQGADVAYDPHHGTQRVLCSL